MMSVRAKMSSRAGMPTASRPLRGSACLGVVAALLLSGCAVGPDFVRPAPPAEDQFTFGDKSVYFDLLELRVRDQIFPLTLMEMNVLRYLIGHADRPVSRGEMLEEVWGLREDTDTRALDNFIVRLRRYIEDDPARPRHLLTVRGVGYRFVAFPRET